MIDGPGFYYAPPVTPEQLYNQDTRLRSWEEERTNPFAIPIDNLEHANRAWLVRFENLAYEGGGGASWAHYYRTKLGALISKFRHLYISSYGGKATLYDNRSARGDYR